MADLIDRQAALDAIMGQPPEPHYPSWYAAQVEKLPAVQPDHNADVSKKVEGDCISRKEALKICRRYWHPTFNPIMEEIEKLPSVQPDIIRCKDCKYSSPNKKYGCRSYHYRLYETHEMKPDDFCSFAERRTDE